MADSFLTHWNYPWRKIYSWSYLRIEKQKSLLAEAKVPQRNVAWKDYKKQNYEGLQMLLIAFFIYNNR